MEVDAAERTKETVTTATAAGTPSASAETASKYPKMDLAQRVHRLLMITYGKLDGDASILGEEVKKEILEDLENSALYRTLEEPLGWAPLDTLAKIDEKHFKTMTNLEEKVEEAKESAGDMEVLDARLAIARFAAKSCNKEMALEMYNKILDLPKLSTGKKIDALMECARVASFHGDLQKNAALIERVSRDY
jgi:26S proteasome regulatory subunit N7